MSGQDPELERRQQAENYSRLTDGELEKIAQDGPSLTEIAREELQAELTRRHSRVVLQSREEGDDTAIEIQDLVPIRKFRDLPEAHLAKGSLESAGIECFLADDNMVRLDWFISNLLGGIKLLVKREDAQAAEEILGQPIPEDFDVEGVGSYHQPRCPVCQSLDVAFQELDKAAAYGSAFLNFPLPVHLKAWKRHACGHEWADTNEGAPDNST